ncbi:protein arginine N-methyltransferase 7-like [Temnothorax curvispinosus]|uniref:Protein arginine N-methyltransferase n=1 Tax=Temnothorax curvispinosus TaxID=300111 RepID=A0A6J1PHA8_9HYME|nr:protein arginine N-methyltransferase 7-like [Temnothorax curvispinosus]XP_024885872.1 protein arginine N-methyltransferase 7-like [Temnothorax curvispinosus]
MLRASFVTAIRAFSNRNMSIFTQCLNPLTGVASWEEKDQYYDYHQEVARSAFADMLHDHERNEKYYIALKAAIEKKHQAGEEANVLDIGTGTGLLSMMAAKCGADTITACEAFKPMANCAAQIIKENGFEDRIKLIRKRSTKMIVGEGGDMPKRANILVTEVFDTELIGEGALSTFRHAHEVLLEEDSIVVPHRGTVWAQVVESTKVCAWNRVKPIKNGEMLVDAPPTIQACSGAAAVHDMQLSRLPRDAFVPLLPAQPIFRFDWSGKKPLLNNEKVSLLTQPIASGTAHAIFMWWDLNMDTDNQVLLSCAPVWEHPDVPDDMKKDATSLKKMTDTIPWRDHWMQAVYYLPEEVPITYGVEVNVIGYHDEYSFWFKLLNGPLNEIPDCQRPECNCWAHIAYSRTRIGQLNDTVRNQRYLQALRRKITPNSVCLCVSDGCLLALAIARLGAKVFLLEQNFLSRRTMEMFVQTNGLSDRVKIVESVDGLPEASEIDFIFGEPYFLSSIVPWENLRFWYLASRYPSSIARLPVAATIKAAAVEFKDLQKIRAPLGACEGFDLSSFDRLIQASSEKSDNPVEAQPLWEYPCKALSSSFDIIKLDLTRNVNFDERKRITGEIPILDSGCCNGVTIWVDWQLDSDLSISCGPIEEIVPGERISWDPYTRQGVHLFRKVFNVTKGSTLSWSFTFVPQSGEVEFEFDVLTND